ncbi:hypothetical protein ASG01_03595 [Chryseobacterium sp. Leaf180]|uniref:hypothetical protein n=1 Tax=Chryseobacterium sp. Leaf180 TaxID=1736289 RepID=UPI0006FD7560|nr:hypothetical protein [Chryseobacterium sp. Leaf180]KQR94960.1 hypothetical protein ASG01_03595 [Chryseobacterium sp. Leaf180]
MIKLFIVYSTLCCGLFSGQKKDQKTVAEKFEAQQPQDFSVPPPPTVAFPAQFPGGNRMFLKEIEKKLATARYDFQGKKFKLIFKIAADGTVLNISVYGNAEDFNAEIKKVAEEIIANKKWIPGENEKGERVIDIVTLPFILSKK